MKESKEIFKFVFNLIEGIKTSSEDGSITVADVPHFFNALVSAPAAFGGANLVLDELVNASSEQKNEFYAWVKDEFDINNDKIEVFVENTFIHIVGIMTNASIAFRKDPTVV